MRAAAMSSAARGVVEGRIGRQIEFHGPILPPAWRDGGRRCVPRLVVYMGWGIATSPLPLAGMAVMLLSDQARRTAATFTAVWFACQVVAIAAFTSVSHALVHLDVSSHKRDIAYGLLAVGVCLLPAAAVMALRNRRHPHAQRRATHQGLPGSSRHRGPREAASMAFATAALNVTNVPYWAAIALVIERAHTNTGGQGAAHSGSGVRREHHLPAGMAGWR